jgi:hypothetical protein
MKAKCIGKPVVKIVFFIFLAFFISGCSAFDTVIKSEDAQTESTEPKSRKTTAVYYDFEDVLIPMELKVVKDATVVVSTPGFTSGIITLRGRVDRRSLFNFFNNNMQKDNWSVLSQIKSPGTTIMVFQKINRTAVITIRDEQIYTYVEVGVAPTVEGGNGFSETSILD